MQPGKVFKWSKAMINIKVHFFAKYFAQWTTHHLLCWNWVLELAFLLPHLFPLTTYYAVIMAASEAEKKLYLEKWSKKLIFYSQTPQVSLSLLAERVENGPKSRKITKWPGGNWSFLWYNVKLHTLHNVVHIVKG